MRVFCLDEAEGLRPPAELEFCPSVVLVFGHPCSPQYYIGVILQLRLVLEKVTW